MGAGQEEEHQGFPVLVHSALLPNSELTHVKLLSHVFFIYKILITMPVIELMIEWLFFLF